MIRTTFLLRPILAPAASWLSRPRNMLLALSVALCVTTALAVALLPGCQPTPNQIHILPSGPPLTLLKQEPTVRVRVLRSATRVTFEGGTTLLIGPSPQHAALATAKPFAAPVTISRYQGHFAIQPAGEQAVTWALPELQIASTDGHLRAEGTSYPQTLVLHSVAGSAHFDVVNHVMMEDYLPGVLEKEFYRSWHPEAFAAQAIAARSYAIDRSSRARGRHFDLGSTQASQVYGGVAANRRAIAAVRQTRGIVLAYNDRVVPAYYSSCCGGTAQDAAIAFPHAVDIPPLRGGRRTGACNSSPYYRWGPITRRRRDLARRIAGWGAARGHPVAAIRSIRDIRVTQANTSGRPARFTIVDAIGKSYVLGPEDFRFACNASIDRLPQLKANRRLRSSHVQVTVMQDKVIFSDGRGFGHGVGLCQWGAQGLAKQGHHAAAILQHYYPGAQLRRAY